jgi:XTP/dITP diphosphohydrolase
LAAWLADQPSALGFPLEPALVLADDSGLEVDALHGAPGVYSARFAAEERQPTESADAANNAKLLRQLQGVPPDQRTARFRCVLAVVQLEPTPGAEGACPPPAQRGAPRLFEGVCEGRIGLAPRGAAGFGYDPLFLPVGSGCSFAELGEATKNQLSHRARALARFKAWLVTRDHGS